MGNACGVFFAGELLAAFVFRNQSFEIDGHQSSGRCKTIQLPCFTHARQAQVSCSAQGNAEHPVGATIHVPPTTLPTSSPSSTDQLDKRKFRENRTSFSRGPWKSGISLSRPLKMIIDASFALSESVCCVEILSVTIDEEHKCVILCKIGILGRGKKF